MTGDLVESKANQVAYKKKVAILKKQGKPNTLKNRRKIKL